jgi:vancomycin resistance protein VanJ
MDGLPETDSRTVQHCRRPRTRRAIALMSWLCLASTLAAWALLRAGDVWWPATFFMFSPRWLLALPPALLILPATGLHRRALVPLLLAVCLVFFPVMGFCIPWRSLRVTAPPQTDLRLLTCNLHYGTIDASALTRLVADSQPDIVVLQHGADSDRSAIFPPDGWHIHRTPSLFLASRHAIQQAQTMGSDTLGHDAEAMRADLETPSGVVSVFNLHLSSPRDGLHATVRLSRRGPAQIASDSALRRNQSENLAAWASRAPGPVLLLGDFNTPPESALFRQEWHGFGDAFATAGCGWGYTFYGGKTMVRIDHILLGPGWQCQHCWVGPNVGSPHRPVLADLRWQGSGS